MSTIYRLIFEQTRVDQFVSALTDYVEKCKTEIDDSCDVPTCTTCLLLEDTGACRDLFNLVFLCMPMTAVTIMTAGTILYQFSGKYVNPHAIEYHLFARCCFLHTETANPSAERYIAAAKHFRINGQLNAHHKGQLKDSIKQLEQCDGMCAKFKTVVENISENRRKCTRRSVVVDTVTGDIVDIVDLCVDKMKNMKLNHYNLLREAHSYLTDEILVDDGDGDDNIDDTDDEPLDVENIKPCIIKSYARCKICELTMFEPKIDEWYLTTFASAAESLVNSNDKTVAALATKRAAFPIPGVTHEEIAFHKGSKLCLYNGLKNLKLLEQFSDSDSFCAGNISKLIVTHLNQRNCMPCSLLLLCSWSHEIMHSNINLQSNNNCNFVERLSTLANTVLQHHEL